MRILRSPRVLPDSRLWAACLWLATLVANSLLAQEPTPPPAQNPPGQNPPAATPPATTPPTATPEAEAPPQGEARRPRRPRVQPLVIEAGTVHPVSGPAIEHGVVVIRGERIVAVGKQGEVELPPNAVVRSFPTGHVYPGLIDAATDAFTDGNLRNDGEADGATALIDDLRRQQTRSDELSRAGITTAYVTVRSPAQLRGQGAIVRPTKAGFLPWAGRERAALQLRMTQGPGASHALQRQQQLQQASSLFEGLDEFRKARTEHEDAVKKYDKEFADYLAWHQKKKDAEAKKDGDAKGGDGKAATPANGEPKPAEGSPATPPPAGDAPPGEGRRRRGGGPPREEPPKNDPPKAPGDGTDAGEATLAEVLALMRPAATQDPKPQDPKPEAPKAEPAKPDPAKADGKPAGAGDSKDEAPKRPTYPKAPARDPQKDALLAVLDGELPLRIEAHREDELRAALALQTTHQIPVLVLEQAYGAGTLARQLGERGTAVVLTDVLPMRLPRPYEHYDVAALPNVLQQAAVPFAIATGDARAASLLPLMAATAVGAGLPHDAALRAITLTPAEILGIQQDTGSLQAGRFADVLVCDRPLFATDSRVLLVLAKGQPEFEAK